MTRAPSAAQTTATAETAGTAAAATTAPQAPDADAAGAAAFASAVLAAEAEAALRRLLRLLGLASAALLVCGAGAGLFLFALHATHERDERLRGAAEAASRAAAALAPAARAASGGAVGDAAARYRDAAADFAAAMQELSAAVPAGSPAAALAARANRSGWARLSLEKRALALARGGQPGAASALLAGGAYRDLSQGAARDRALLAAGARDDARRLALWERAGLGASAALSALCAALLPWLGVPAARRLSAWRRSVAAHLRERQKAQERMAGAHARLERDLRARAADLDLARRELEQQVSLRRGSDAERNLLSQAVQSANDVVLITQAEEGMPPRVVYVNQAFERMTGYARSEIIGKSPKLLQGPDTDPATLSYLRAKLRAREPAQAELLNYRRDGSTFWVELNIRPIRDETGFQTHWISIQRDVTGRKQAEDKIRWQATHDSLTGLPNRVLYQDRLADAVALAQPRGASVGVLFFDLDRFKHINDTLGHGVGDRLLQAVARRLEQRLRTEDTIARIGGDEFAILLPYHDLLAPEACAHASEIAAQRILDGMDAPFVIDGHELYVTASIGISIAPRDGTDIEGLLQRADTAMYRAKEQGRDSYRVYTETMSARALDRLVLETNLRRALERGEFHLLYQPQVNLVSGRVYGVEALLRWDNPQLGRIPPAQFIGVAEETGLIVPIGAWALREACLQAVRWREAGRPLHVSVNLSARQFQQQDLVFMVAAVLQETGLDPEALDLELTESTLLQEKEALAILTALKAIGVRLSVDDFGTGYSQFSYLRTFPFDVLKIDRSFIVDLLEDRKSEAVVRYLIGMAHDVGLGVVVEGVETDLQRTMLLGMGCDSVQGYLFSPPTTPAEVLRLSGEAERLIDKEGKRLVLSTAKNLPPG